MSTMGSLSRAVGAAIAALAVAAVLSSPAYAEVQTPWWAITSGSRPTNLRSGAGRDEVERMTVSATEGDVLLLEPVRLKEFEAGRRGFEELRYAIVPYNATASRMQEAFEAIYPYRKVAVTGGPGDEKGSTPYVITFPSQAVDQESEPITVNGALAPVFGGEALSCAEGATGCTASAGVAEVSKGDVEGQIIVDAQNRGDANTSGSITVSDELPKGLEAVEVTGIAGETGVSNRGPVSCSLRPLSCTYGAGTYLTGSGEEQLPESLPPYEAVEMRVAVRVLPGAASGEQNTASVSGGGAARAVSASRPIQAGGGERFGIESLQMIPENAGGTIDTQAGSHPFQMTSVLKLNETTPAGHGREPLSVGMAKDIVTELPAGLVGNPTPFPQCTDEQFGRVVQPPAQAAFWNACPAQSAIGIAVTAFDMPGSGFDQAVDPIFNMQPLPGEPARFGFKVGGITPVFLDTSVRTGKDYGVTVTSRDITQIASFLGVTLTFWGVPGDPRHDNVRGWECQLGLGGTRKGFTCPASNAAAPPPPPLLVLPTTCQAPFEVTARGDSWEAFGLPAEQAEPLTYRLPEELVGCNHLPFAPSISVAPDVPDGSSSTGLTVGVHVAQKASLNPEGLSESTLKDTTVALPEGVGLNPAGADGLDACSEAQIGFAGVEPGSGVDLFTSGLPEPFCPDASKIGTVKIETPLLPNPLEGAVYLAAQNANPFGSLVAMYIVARDPVSGVLVKLPGLVHLDERTGRVVATFENTPDLPFEDLELHFFGGERAPLGTPALCGSYTTEAAFTPWSGNETARPTTTFQITSGPNGRPCSDPLPFSPSLTAGTTSIQAGGLSPFTMTMSREDGNQNLQSVQLKMPPGMSGTLSTVKLCGEADADAGTCGQESLIGETTVSVGLGGDPFTVTGGKVYITGPYRGAPFGLSIVNPAKAGPFDLGKVVVRAKIEVDRETAALTITTDDEGPHKIPTIIDGIPLQIKHVNVLINRSGFTFNPTDCSPLAITGTLRSSEGAAAGLSVPFQVTNCAVLAFRPKLTASTAGKTSRVNGASLTVKLAYPAGPYDANISRVKVELPKTLPSRLTTLQKACTAQVFEANPANCPAASIVGHATATTPVLPVPLIGPAYFVSHGGEAFPSLIIVLQGYGVTVHLVGSTFISKKGITSSTFKSVPDVPVGTFELTLPQGPFSALSANTNLCKAALVMPTEFVGQNGAQIKTNTKIAATGCVKRKKSAHRRRAPRKSHGGRGARHGRRRG